MQEGHSPPTPQRRDTVDGTTTRPAQEAVELRVHGVSGTPPEHLLECPKELLEQLSGDKNAGIYRRRSLFEVIEGNHTPAERECYYWGGLTSRAASRALWLLFLPFLLVNLAHWMLPLSTTGPRAPAMCVRLLRLIGLAFTLSLLWASMTVLMDTVGWQCASVAHCAAHLGPAKFLLNMPRERQLMFTAIPVAVMPVVLMFLGRPNSPACVPPSTCSAVDQSSDTAPPHPAVTSDQQPPLADPNFWSPDDSLKRLRCCHVMAWASGLGAFILAPLLHYPDTSVLRPTCWVLLSVQIAVVALSIAATASNRLTGRGGKTADPLTKPMQKLQWVSVALLAATLAVVAFTKPEFNADSVPDPTPMPGLEEGQWALQLGQIVLLLLLFAFTARCMNSRRGALKAIVSAFAWPVRSIFVRRSGESDESTQNLGGFLAPFVATIGFFVMSASSIGANLWAAQVVGTPVRSQAAAKCALNFRATVLDEPGSGRPPLSLFCSAQRIGQLPHPPASFEQKVDVYDAATPIIVPLGSITAAIVFSMLALLLAGWIVVVWRVLVRRWAYRNEFYQRYADTSDETVRTRALEVARARVLASLTDRTPGVLAGFTVITVPLFAAIAVAAYARMRALLELGNRDAPSPGLSTVCMYLLSASAVGILALAFAAVNNREQRRHVGVLWDVITFWPQANHPLTPPCYAERTVPELAGQLRHLGGEGRPVVLAAHSQGSIIAAATILQTDPEALRRIRLLTFGCPLRRLYARNFPAYFGSQTLRAVHDRLPGGWINLWAPTDPIGSWVLDKSNRTIVDAPATVDCRICDVTGLHPQPRGSYPPICGHSGFWARDEFGDAAELLLDSLNGTNVPPTPQAVTPSVATAQSAAYRPAPT